MTCIFNKKSLPNTSTERQVSLEAAAGTTFDPCGAAPCHRRRNNVQTRNHSTDNPDQPAVSDKSIKAQPLKQSSSFGWGQTVLLSLLLWDHCGSANPQPPVVVSCSAPLRWGSTNCLCDQKRLLRQSDSIPPALLGSALNWMPQNNGLIMRLSESLSCFPCE